MSVTRRPRLVRVITRLNVGGPARQALLLTRELADQYDTVLVAGRPGPREGQLTDPAVRVSHVSLARPIQPIEDARALVEVRRVLADGPTALVHTHMAKAGTVARLALQTVRPRPRCIHTFHGHVLDGYFRPLVSRAFVEAERQLARVTDVLVAVSPQIREELLELGIGKPAQFLVLPVGLDIEPFLAVRRPSGLLRKKLGLAAEVALAGVVGRLAPVKDNTTLLRAVSLLPTVHLAVIGDGELRAKLEGQARALGIMNRVHFVGWWDDVPAAMSDLDVVVLTSRNEGTPVSLIEALAARRPVVATDVGGVKFVVEDGRTGLLAEPGDASGVAAAIAKLLGNRELAAELASAGRVLVSKRFGKARLVAEVRSLYAEVLGPGFRSRGAQAILAEG